MTSEGTPPRSSVRACATVVLLPAITPDTVVALRSAIGLGFMFVVAAELMGASEGLGYLLVDGQQMGRADSILVSLIVFALLGKACAGLHAAIAADHAISPLVCALVGMSGLAVAIVGLWWWARPIPGPVPPPARQASAGGKVAAPGPSEQAATPNPKSAESRLADGLNAAGGTIESDLRIVLGVIEAFRLNFPREGNPVGSNAEITAALHSVRIAHEQMIRPTEWSAVDGILSIR